MKKRNTRSFVIIFLIWLSLGILAGCSMASDDYPSDEPQSGEPTESQSDGQLETPIPTQTMPKEAIFYERRLITVEWPQSIKMGDSERMQLILEVDEEGKITPTAIIEENEFYLEPVFIPDLYDDYYLNAEARLDIAGIDILPQGTVSTALIKNKDIVFAWSLSPRQIGSFSGTIWLYLNIIPKEGGISRQELILAKPVSITTVNVFGLPATVARWGGLVGAGFSFILGFPFFEEIFLWLLKRLKKSSIIKSNQS